MCILGLSNYDLFGITIIDGKWSICVIQYKTMIKLLKFMKRSCWVTIVNHSLNRIEDTCRITIVWLVLLIYFKWATKNTDMFTFSGRRQGQDLSLFTIIMTSNSTIRFITGLSLVKLLSMHFFQIIPHVSSISSIIRTQLTEYLLSLLIISFNYLSFLTCVMPNETFCSF